MTAESFERAFRTYPKGNASGAQSVPDEFAIDLCKTSSPNQIILARVQRAETLAETLDRLDQLRAEFDDMLTPAERYGRTRQFELNDILLVPELNVSVTHRFRELEGNNKRVQNSKCRDYWIEIASQTVRFKLDRSGTELDSWASILKCRGMARAFIFDRPFLIIMKKRTATRPFLVMWIETPELLTPWNPATAVD